MATKKKVFELEINIARYNPLQSVYKHQYFDSWKKNGTQKFPIKSKVLFPLTQLVNPWLLGTVDLSKAHPLFRHVCILGSIISQKGATLNFINYRKDARVFETDLGSFLWSYTYEEFSRIFFAGNCVYFTLIPLGKFVIKIGQLELWLCESAFWVNNIFTHVSRWDS